MQIKLKLFTDNSINKHKIMANEKFFTSNTKSFTTKAGGHRGSIPVPFAVLIILKPLHIEFFKVKKLNIAHIYGNEYIMIAVMTNHLDNI